MKRFIIPSGILIAEFILFLSLLVNRKFHTAKGYFLTLIVLIVFIISGKLFLFPPVKPVKVKGNYTPVSWNTYFVDQDRIDPYCPKDGARELPVQFWYPKNYDKKEKCPFVVFSHGNFGRKERNETLFRYLAANGYVVCTIDHTYHAFSTKLSSGKTARMSSSYLEDLRDDEPSVNPEASVKHFQEWMKIRMDDINCVLDSTISNVNKGEQEKVYQLIDPERIGVMGLSLGGSAALGIGRNRNDIKAVIALESPFLADIKGVKENKEFIFTEEEYPVPVMIVYTDGTWSHLREWNQYGENVKLLNSTRSDVRNVHIEGMGHFSMSDFCLISPFITALLEGGSSGKDPVKNLLKVNEICKDFWDEYI